MERAEENICVVRGFFMGLPAKGHKGALRAP